MYDVTFSLVKQKGNPLYVQLYTYLVAEMKSGRLPRGERLPSKRNLAEHLSLSQNTVETAYQMLVREGYVTARPKSGFYVNDLGMFHAPQLFTSTVAGSFPGEAPSSSSPKKQEHYRYDFHTGSIDVDSFPFATWAKLSKEVMYQNQDLLAKGDAQGDLCLREAIAAHIHQFRGVCCTAQQIVVGAGLEYLMSLLQVLLPQDSVFALENPGYFKTYNLLKNQKREMLFIPLDEKGLRLDALEKTTGSVLAITPSHQFPTGRIMPIGRRLELLQWAYEREDRYIIEDDYDSEFSFSGRPIPAVQGLDQQGKVIYLSTFSRSLAPSVRIAYMVLPPALLLRYQACFQYYSSTVSRFEQYTLAHFMTGGFYGRHLNRMRNVYRKRRELLVAKAAALGLQVAGDDVGLHLLLPIPGLSEQAVVAAAKVGGIKLHGLSMYYLAEPVERESPALVLGYAGIQLSQLAQGMDQLGEILKTI